MTLPTIKRTITEEKIQIQWLEKSRMKKVLRSVAKQWYLDVNEYLDETIGEIQFGILGAENKLYPYPYVGIASISSLENHVIGLLCGHDEHGLGLFHIDFITIHPIYQEHDVIRKTLIEAAIDRSILMGYHGWLACCPRRGLEHRWKELGFSKYDEFSYRRMGYFVKGM